MRIPYGGEDIGPNSGLDSGSPTISCGGLLPSMLSVSRTRKRKSMTVDEVTELLAGTPVFGELDEAEVRELAEIAIPRHWQRGEVIFREHQAGDCSYVLGSGAVLLLREHPDGRAVGLAELRAGDMFGELSVFRARRRSATAEAIEPATGVALVGSDVQRLLRRHPKVAVKLLAGLAERLEATNDRLFHQTFQTLEGRVARAVGALAASRQAHADAGGEVCISVTQSHIASLAGTSRESASRFLATLERAGILTAGRGKLTVHHPDRLKAYVYEA